MIARPPSAKDARKHGRLACELLHCTLGEVLDISASGMRVKHRGRFSTAKGETITTTIQVGATKIPAKVKIAWVRRAGFWSHQIGLEFVEMTDESRKVITQIGRLSRKARVIADEV